MTLGAQKQATELTLAKVTIRLRQYLTYCRSFAAILTHLEIQNLKFSLTDTINFFSIGKSRTIKVLQTQWIRVNVRSFQLGQLNIAILVQLSILTRKILRKTSKMCCIVLWFWKQKDSNVLIMQINGHCRHLLCELEPSSPLPISDIANPTHTQPSLVGGTRNVNRLNWHSNNAKH